MSDFELLLVLLTVYALGLSLVWLLKRTFPSLFIPKRAVRSLSSDRFRWIAATILRGMTPVVALVAFELTKRIPPDPGDYFPSGWKIRLMVIFTMIVISQMLTLAKRLLAIGAQEVMSNDPRPPVLYLRPFSVDPWGGAFEGPVVVQDFIRFGRSVEEKVADQVQTRGPFVTLHDPTKPLPYPGASRWSVHDDDWRLAVGDLLLKAQLVILVVDGGITDSYLWEIEQALRTTAPQRVWLILPFTAHPKNARRRYDAFRAAAGRFFPSGLPEQKDGDALITFNSDWEGTTLPLKKFLWGYYGFDGCIKAALESTPPPESL